MKRHLMQELAAWKEKDHRKPLILKGARQVGKTWLMKEFGRLYFKKVAYITFYNNQRMKRVFDEDYDIERILVNINIEAHTEVTPEDTLIILDEIQEAPRALEALKYFCENAPEYAVVAAGSLLGVAIHAGVFLSGRKGGYVGTPSDEFPGVFGGNGRGQAFGAVS